MTSELAAEQKHLDRTYAAYDALLEALSVSRREKHGDDFTEEVLEQIVHADRLGYDCYTIIEHYFFPQFSIEANPWLMFGKASERTKNINFRTLGHPVPYINSALLASQICGTPIARVDYEEHTVYYCPDCQTGGRILKDRRLSRLLR